MDRRVGGIIMLVLVLVAAAVIPNIAARTITGHPVAVGVPDPPAVGSCVSSVPPASIASDSSSRYLALAVLEYGSCAVHHYGEITAVLPDLPPQTNPFYSSGAPRSPGTSGPDTELLDRCPSQSLIYLGMADPPSGNATDPAGWTPALNATFVFAGPDARQKAAGQKWGACVLVALPGQNDQAPVTFPGPLRNAVATGRLPGFFGTCAPDLSIESSGVPCTDWHSYEILGQADLTTSTTSAAAQLASCRKIALRVTRMPDPTAGGRLQLRVEVDRLDANGMVSIAAGPLKDGETRYGTCGIHAVGTAKLHGSLLGLGTAPVPLG